MTWKPSSSYLDSVNMTQIMNALDEKSAQILIYLLKERHAGIRKLADLINASSDMEVLVKIRRALIQRFKRLWGNLSSFLNLPNLIH